MAVRTLIVALLLCLTVWAQEKVEFVCPMDPDVRSAGPAKCPRCGMKLVAGLPHPEEHRVEVKTVPAAPKPGEDVDLVFRVVHLKTGKAVTKFELVHEKLFHLFIVSEDLRYFAHEHPEAQADGTFRFRYRFPQGGAYHLLSDFYPQGATPQLVTQTLVLPGHINIQKLSQDMAEQQGENMRVSLRTEPREPIAGMKTLLFFDLDSAEKLEPYLGAWGHLLVASEDSIDMIHSHPAFEEAGKTIQFNVIFPRPGMHRLWVQFQKDGKVNTLAFNVPVSELK
jgi:hypothetical protein